MRVNASCYFEKIARYGFIHVTSPMYRSSHHLMASLIKLLLCLLIFNRQLVISSSNTFEDERKTTVDHSSISTAYSTVSRPRIMPSLNGLSSDLLILIGEYIDFPHATLGSTNRYIRSVLNLFTPAQMVARQLSWSQLSILPTCPDLKYLSTLTRKGLQERLLEIILDASLLKCLPNIKGPLLRFLFQTVTASFKSENVDSLVLPLHHPFKGVHSPLSALITAFIDLKDYEAVFDIWTKFPLTRARMAAVFTEELVKAAISQNKLEVLLTFYTGLLSVQDQFDVTCLCLALTLDERVLMLFLTAHYHQSEYWGLEYSTTFINAWIFALSSNWHGLSKLEILPILEAIYVNLANIFGQNTQHLRLQSVLLGIISIQRGFAHDVVDNFNLFPLNMHETILGCLMIEGEFNVFFSILRECLRLDAFFSFKSKQLRREITKAPEPFIQVLLDEFNVNMLFSNDLYEDAFYNKKLYFKILHVENEEEFITTCQLGPILYRYAMEHFIDLSDWSSFFALKHSWSARSFSEFLQFILRDPRGRRVDLFDLMTSLLDGKQLHIAFWGINTVEVDSEAAKFLLLHAVPFLNRPRIKQTIIFRTLGTVELLSSGLSSELLSLLKFDSKDIFIQLPHEKDYKRYLKITNNRTGGLNLVKRAIKEFYELNRYDGDQDQFYSAIETVFNPIIEPLKWSRPLDYLLILPYSMLLKSIRSDPNLLRRVLHDLTASQDKISTFLFSIRSNTGLRVKGPLNLSASMTSLLQKHRITLTIV